MSDPSNTLIQQMPISLSVLAQPIFQSCSFTLTQTTQHFSLIYFRSRSYLTHTFYQNVAGLGNINIL